VYNDDLDADPNYEQFRENIQKSNVSGEKITEYENIIHSSDSLSGKEDLNLFIS